MLQINVGFFHIKNTKTCLAKHSHFRKVQQLTNSQLKETKMETKTIRKLSLNGKREIEVSKVMDSFCSIIFVSNVVSGKN